MEFGESPEDPIAHHKRLPESIRTAPAESFLEEPLN